jgi:hypothetical protein
MRNGEPVPFQENIIWRIERGIKGKYGSPRKSRVFSRIFIIQVALQSGHASRTRILLSSDQLAEFQNLIQQAKSKLDSLRDAK